MNNGDTCFARYMCAEPAGAAHRCRLMVRGVHAGPRDGVARQKTASYTA